MNTSSKILIKRIFWFSVFIACSNCFVNSAAIAAYYQSPQIIPDEQPIVRNPFRPAPNPWKSIEPELPEIYIDTTLRQSLNQLLPQHFRKGLNLGASYDRLVHLPTMHLDYFLPVKAWPDKSFFLNPRISLTSKNESLSVGAGFRHLLGSDVMVGFHTFHDWVRPRKQSDQFLKEIGVGFELSVLPGKYSDIIISGNAYFPINERSSLFQGEDLLSREALCTGFDARIGFGLPALVNWLDMRLDARAHSYRGAATDDTGYKAGLSVNTRDGMFRAVFEQEKDNRKGEQYRIEGSINLAFDWKDLLNGEVPFSAPYSIPQSRYNKKIRDALSERVVRKHDVPSDRTERRLALVTRVSDQTVFFSGGFAELPNARVTVQVSQSPWQDRGEVITDSSGCYSGTVKLQPGTYRLRLIHRPTGRISSEKMVVIPKKDE